MRILPRRSMSLYKRQAKPVNLVRKDHQYVLGTWNEQGLEFPQFSALHGNFGHVFLLIKDASAVWRGACIIMQTGDSSYD